ncbi:MAG TPA: thioredoxin family protein [Terriglobia bacterium]|nr:thioredoxin family protein [Terriglobia bacterium]
MYAINHEKRIARPSTSFEHKNVPPALFDGTTVTQRELDALFTTARAQHKYAMIEFGANWCGDCLDLSRELEESPTREFVQQHLVVLRVDVGNFDHNLEAAHSLGVDMSVIPAAVFVAPDNGRFTASGTKEIQAFLKNLSDRAE